MHKHMNIYRMHEWGLLLLIQASHRSTMTKSPSPKIQMHTKHVRNKYSDNTKYIHSLLRSPRGQAPWGRERVCIYLIPFEHSEYLSIYVFPYACCKDPL